MRRLVTALLLTVFIFSGTGVALADHHGRDRHDRKEYREDRRPGHNQHDRHKYDKKDKKRQEKFWKNQRKHQREVRHHHNNDRRIREMARYASRGGRFMDAWRISDDTYIVKYYKGGRYYTRRFYPYTGRYGAPTLISVNWVAPSIWSLLPSINININ